MTQQTLEELQDKLRMFNEISDPIFIEWNKKHDMMMKGGKMYLYVFSKERMRPVFKGVVPDTDGFKFTDEVLIPERVGIEDAGRGFGKKKLIQV